MDERTKPARFDEDARNRIRAALRAYMAAHRIGVPTLRDRMIDADARRRDVSLSSLQRFLRGTHRSSDMLVGMGLNLLEAERFETPNAQGDALRAFEDASSTFYAPPADVEDQPSPLTRIAGRYVPVVQEGGAMSMSMAPTADGRALRVAETHAVATFEQFEPVSLTYRYEGVIVWRGRALLGLLRNTLTREPRIYWLSEAFRTDADEPLELNAEVHETPFRLPLKPGTETRTQVMRLRKVEEEGT